MTATVLSHPAHRLLLKVKGVADTGVCGGAFPSAETGRGAAGLGAGGSGRTMGAIESGRCLVTIVGLGSGAHCGCTRPLSVTTKAATPSFSEKGFRQLLQIKQVLWYRPGKPDSEGAVTIRPPPTMEYSGLWHSSHTASASSTTVEEEAGTEFEAVASPLGVGGLGQELSAPSDTSEVRSGVLMDCWRLIRRAL